MQKITPCLWFDGNAEEAIDFYSSIFKDSKLINVSRHGEGGSGPKGSVLAATFQLNGQQFMAINGGPMFRFTEAVSFYVSCETQAEIDEYWNKLQVGGGKPQMCGWLKDRFGVSWQIVPPILEKLLSDKDPAKAKRTMDAMLKMVKIDIEGLKKAHAG